ncbi:MAG: hypothetical protein QXW20_08400 [Ignisphaera sp.]
MYSVEYSSVERYRSIFDEIADLVAKGKIGNPIPIGTLLGYILAGILAGLGVLAGIQFWRSTDPVVRSIEQVAPIIASAFSILMLAMTFIPFFFVFTTIMGIFGE